MVVDGLARLKGQIVVVAIVMIILNHALPGLILGKGVFDRVHGRRRYAFGYS